MNKRHSLTRYSLSGESSRWWWPSATAGAAATLAVAAIVGSSSAGNAIPVDPDRYRSLDEASLPAATLARDPIHSQDDIPPGFRQCFMWQSHWNDALNGPQPWCRLDWRRAGAASRHQTAFSLREAELNKSLPIP
jgi:hypothetical protein